MADAGMDVINPSGHRLNGGQVGRHQPFRHRTPVTQIRCEPKAWMAGQPGRHAPGVEQRTTAMRLERHRNGTGIDLIQNAVKKAMLLDLIPAVAAGDQRDLERGQRHSPLQAALNLIKMLCWRAIEIGGVIPPSNNFKDQMLVCIGDATSDRFWIKGFETGVVEIDFKAVKPIACSRYTSLVQGRRPAPQCFEQQQP